jgi:hypothetical protein
MFSISCRRKSHWRFSLITAIMKTKCKEDKRSI